MSYQYNTIHTYVYVRCLMMWIDTVLHISTVNLWAKIVVYSSIVSSLMLRLYLFLSVTPFSSTHRSCHECPQLPRSLSLPRQDQRHQIEGVASCSVDSDPLTVDHRAQPHQGQNRQYASVPEDAGQGRQTELLRVRRHQCSPGGHFTIHGSSCGLSCLGFSRGREQMARWVVAFGGGDGR